MADPQAQAAPVVRTVRTQWKGRLRSEARVRDCVPFIIDEPPNRGGRFEHPTPAEYTLAALTGCAAAHVEMFAKEVGMPLVDLTIEGRLTMLPVRSEEDGGGGGVQGIELELTVTSPGTAEQFRRVRELLRSQCVLYRFAKAATKVEDRWMLVSPAG
ncbi:MAG: OsmC family protein [Nitrospinota bacterium]